MIKDLAADTRTRDAHPYGLLLHFLGDNDDSIRKNANELVANELKNVNGELLEKINWVIRQGVLLLYGQYSSLKLTIIISQKLIIPPW